MKTDGFDVTSPAAVSAAYDLLSAESAQLKTEIEQRTRKLQALEVCLGALAAIMVTRGNQDKPEKRSAVN
jgi:hypothetical protein